MRITAVSPFSLLLTSGYFLHNSLIISRFLSTVLKASEKTQTLRSITVPVKLLQLLDDQAKISYIRGVSKQAVNLRSSINTHSVAHKNLQPHNSLTMHDEDIYEAAHKKVQAKKGFLYHFAAFASVIGLLYAIFYFEGGGYLPVVIVGLSWGIGIAIHYLKTFGTEHLDFLGISPNWEEEELEQEIERLKKRKAMQEQIKQEKSQLNDADSLELKEIEKRPLDDNAQR